VTRPLLACAGCTARFRTKAALAAHGATAGHATATTAPLSLWRPCASCGCPRLCTVDPATRTATCDACGAQWSTVVRRDEALIRR
jgi:hypothetical protein